MTAAVDRVQDASPVRDPVCAQCDNPLPPQEYRGRPRKFCSRKCRDDASNARRRDRVQDASPVRDRRKRRPLPDAASDAAWALRRDVDRVARLIDDDRFVGVNKEKLAPLLRGQLSYAVQACQDLMNRIDNPTGE